MYVKDEVIQEAVECFDLSNFENSLHNPERKQRIRNVASTLSALLASDTGGVPPAPVEGELPRYKSHKIVQACKILKLTNRKDGSKYVYPVGDLQKFSIDSAFVKKHAPEVSGYIVIYADGYTSFSPAEAFEEGYSPVEQS